MSVETEQTELLCVRKHRDHVHKSGSRPNSQEGEQAHEIKDRRFASLPLQASLLQHLECYMVAYA